MTQHKKSLPLIIFICLILVIFLSLNITVRLLGSSLKVDMTANQRYSLSPASQKILSSLTSPVQIKLYLSNSWAQENPAYANYAQFVTRYLRKYQQIAGADKIKIEIIDPKPFSATEEDAKKAGLKALPDLSGQSNLYFGAVISNALGKSAVIPNFITARSGYLETDISRILAKLNTGSHKNVGLVSPQLPLITHAYGQAIPNWAIVAQIQNDYNIIELSDRIAQIPTNIDVLLVINPGQLSPLFAYALDQYVLRGGKLIVLSDIFSDKKAADKGKLSATSANMNPLFQSWGFSIPQDKVVGDRTLGEMVTITTPNGPQSKNFPYWLQLTSAQINQNHPITQGLSRISIKSAGMIVPQKDNPQIKITPLLTTTPHANSVDKALFQKQNQSEQENKFAEGNEQYILAAEIDGKFSSAFSKNVLDGTPSAQKLPPYLPYSIAQGKIIIVSDSDFIVAENWADTGATLNNPVYGLAPVYDNGAFLLRLLDYLTGKEEVLGLHNTEPLNIKTVGENIYTHTFNKYADAYSQAQAELNQRQLLAQNYAKATQQAFTPLTAQQIKELETNKQRISDLQQEINKIAYQIKEENTQELSRITDYNIIYIPVLTVLVILLIYLIIKKRAQKRIGGIANELHSN